MFSRQNMGALMILQREMAKALIASDREKYET
jgi:hypothetical protein